MQYLVSFARAVVLALPFALPLYASGAVEPYVNVAGEPLPTLPASAAGSNPGIEKLLAQPSDLWERIRLGFAIPALGNPRVAQHATWYAARPELVQAIALRARRYLHYIVDEVERRGMPMELALLPFIESGFNPMALSPAQASGLWQFIPETGSRYNLAQGAHYDGRRDIVASTGAALDYLQFLYEYNRRDWQLALASYNWGESAVARAIERNRVRGLPETYDSLTMPEETRNYVPRLLAIRQIVLDPAAHGIQLAEIPNEPFFGVVRMQHDLELRLAAQFAGMPIEEFLTLNPAFNSKHAPGATGPGLLIPIEKAEAFMGNLERYRAELARQVATRPASPTPAKSRSAARL